MALCGVKTGNSILLLKYSWRLLHNVLTSLQNANKWIAVSSSRWQKDDKVVSEIANEKILLFKNKTLLRILYWKTRSLLSIVTIRGKM